MMVDAKERSSKVFCRATSVVEKRARLCSSMFYSQISHYQHWGGGK